jgi:molecular chaperone GrpE
LEAKVSEEDRKGKGDMSEETKEKISKDLQGLSSSRPVLVSQPPAEEKEEAQAEEEAPHNELEEARKEAAANRDRWIRAVADLENYKKRAIQERSNILKYKNEEILRDLIVVMDNMDRAVNYCAKEGITDPLAEGVCMISGMFKNIFDRYGVKEIKAINEPFDPHLHEAVARVPAGNHENNTVVEELEKGYMYQDRLLRPSKVVVAVASEKGES